MATVSTEKVTDLTANTTAADTDLLIVGNAGTATLRKITFANLRKTILGATTALSALKTTAKDIVGAINELKTSITVQTGTLTAASGMAFLSSKACYVKKQGNIVHVVFTITNSSISANTETILATLPEGFRPSTSMEGFFTASRDAAGNAQVTIYPSGKISVYVTTNVTWCTVNAAFFTD